MAVLFGLLEEGQELGLPAASIEKLKPFGESALTGLEMMKRAGVRMGFGTDLLGKMHVRQSTEFTLREGAGWDRHPSLGLYRQCGVDGTNGKARVHSRRSDGGIPVDGNPLEDISTPGPVERPSLGDHEGREFAQTDHLSFYSAIEACTLQQLVQEHSQAPWRVFSATLSFPISVLSIGRRGPNFYAIFEKSFIRTWPCSGPSLQRSKGRPPRRTTS